MNDLEEQPSAAAVITDDPDDVDCDYYEPITCNHDDIEDGDVVRVIDEYANGVRGYDLGVNPEVRGHWCLPFEDEHEAFCVWPSGTAMWLPIDQLEVTR
jgi:hypothetical protein